MNVMTLLGTQQQVEFLPVFLVIKSLGFSSSDYIDASVTIREILSCHTTKDAAEEQRRGPQRVEEHIGVRLLDGTIYALEPKHQSFRMSD